MFNDYDYDVTADMRRKSLTQRIIGVILGVLYVLVLIFLLGCSIYTSYDLFINVGAYVRGFASLIAAGLFLFEIIRFLLDTDAKVTKRF